MSVRETETATSTAGQTRPPEVSVIIPCLNEEQSVGQCVTQALGWFERKQVPGEVVVIDNNSTDRTAEVAVAAGARVVRESRPGKGHAVRRGIAESSGEIIVMADGDGTYDLTQLEALVDPLRDGYDMVIGNRLRGEMQRDAMPRLHRWLGNPVINLIIGLVTRRWFGDCLSGLRSFRRDAWREMAPSAAGFELESEMCLRAGRHGLRVTHVPIPYGVRKVPSKLRTFTHGWAIARFILLESADIVFFVPAVIAVLLGVLSLAVGLAVTRGIEVGSVRWQPVFAGGILVPGGIAFLALGLAAKWQAWRRGIAKPGRLVRILRDPTSRALEILLLGGVVLLSAGVVLDVYLLWNWARDEPVSRALGLGAVAQTMIIAGLNVIVAAVLLGILRSDDRFDDPDREEPT